ncbi:MAG: NAD(P)-binding protein [Planctomycetaceae bacterium]
MSEQVIIVGGGLAGLAAAVAATDRGVPVTLLEARQRLGGRAARLSIPSRGRLWITASTSAWAAARTCGISAKRSARPICSTRSAADVHCAGRNGVSVPRPAAAGALHLLVAFRGLTYFDRREENCSFKDCVR